MKTKTCKCGAMSVTFRDKATVEIQNGWLFGSPHTHARCFECPSRIRIAYTVIHIDKNGDPIKSNRSKSGKPARKRTRKGHSRKPEAQVWRFVD